MGCELWLEIQELNDKHMQDFRNLKVWEKAHELVLDIYLLTMKFPKEEKFGLISQLRRAAASIPTNIAEGTGHRSEKEFGRYLQMSIASSCEVEYLMVLSKDLGYYETSDEFTNRIVSIRRMLVSLRAKLK
jgi:four helix bundle protein